jgi:rhodanese-related sulfurtransferase
MSKHLHSARARASMQAFQITRRHGLAFFGLSALGMAGGCSAAPPDTDVVSLDEARAEFESGRALLIDIREPEEHATGVAAGARLLPMRQIGRRLDEIPTDPSRPVLLICNTQNHSSATLRALRERGYSHVRYVNGGMSEWARRGWPMVKPGG